MLVTPLASPQGTKEVSLIQGQFLHHLLKSLGFLFLCMNFLNS